MLRPLTVADRLEGARRRRFVGRAAELELFDGALAAAEPPFSVLWLCGPGGVGKSTLLAALEDAAAAAGREPVVLDLRSLEPSPPAFTTALGRACGAQPGAAFAGRDRPVLLLDTLEAAAGLEDWLRESFLPALPAGALTVIAARSRPSAAWRRDPGWADLLRVVSLRNLAPEDTLALLERSGVTPDLHERLHELTHGHPLALALLIDVLRQDAMHQAPFELADVPDVIDQLVASFLAGVPSARHRRALEIAAHSRHTTAALLRLLQGDDSDALFAWLRSLSFMDAGPHGLFPHDLARTVIDADLRWRDPAAYAEVHRGVRADVVRRLAAESELESQRALADLMFLHRGNASARLFWDWDSLGEVYADALRPEDHATILAMVERHEGPESARLAAFWLERQPSAWAVFRGGGTEVLGCLAQLSLHATDERDIARDPGARAAWGHAQRHAPPRPGDEVLMGRFMLDRDAYQAPSRSFNVVTIVSTQEWLRRTRLSWYYLAFADAQAAGPLMAHIDFQRAPAADFDVGGRRLAAFARDWRRGGGAEWLEAMATRELGAGTPAPVPVVSPDLALSQADFAEAVRRALRDWRRPDALAASPLLRTRLVRDRHDNGTAVDVLRSLVETAVRELEEDPRDARLARAVERTYLKPAPTQEAAAELLGLPFSTYRGHLARGQERVTAWLWARELYGDQR